MEDFPKATQAPPSAPPGPAPKKLSPEEKQFDACKKVISNLTVKKYFESVSFREDLFPSVLKKLESSGFEVAYTVYYASKTGYDVKVTIADPGLRTKYLQEKKENFNSFADGSGLGGNKELKEGLTALVDMFVGGSKGLTDPGPNVTTATFPF